MRSLETPVQLRCRCVEVINALEKHTFRKKIVGIVEDFLSKNQNNNGKLWKSLKIFACEDKNLLIKLRRFRICFLHVSSFFHFVFFFCIFSFLRIFSFSFFFSVYSSSFFLFRFSFFFFFVFFHFPFFLCFLFFFFFSSIFGFFPHFFFIFSSFFQWSEQTPKPENLANLRIFAFLIFPFFHVSTLPLKHFFMLSRFHDFQFVFSFFPCFLSFYIFLSNIENAEYSKRSSYCKKCEF